MAQRLLLLAAAALSLLAAAPVAAIEPTTVARHLEPSMVRVTLQGPEVIAGGTGFVISRQGHVVTNYHVVQPHIEAGWKLFAAESGAAPDARRPAAVVKAYPEEDLAVLKVDGLARPPAVLSDSGADALSQGTTVFAIGYPEAGQRLGGDSGTSFTAGIANRIFLGAWQHDGERIRIIQHSAATNPGNSGGPVVNPCGQVVGVNTEREMAVVITPGGLPIVYDVIQGVFFASHVSVLIEKLKALGVPYYGTHKVCRVFLGVASTNFLWFGLAAGVVLLALVLLFVRGWQRRAVHVIVLGGGAARNGARALGRTLLHPGRPRDAAWRLRCEDAAGGPIDIVISEADLRRAPKGLTIGCDPVCDRCLSADGIAGKHAQLVPMGEALGVADLHSETGTAVDERPVDPDAAPAPVKPGARLRLGKLTFTVERG